MTDTSTTNNLLMGKVLLVQQLNLLSRYCTTSISFIKFLIY